MAWTSPACVWHIDVERAVEGAAVVVREDIIVVENSDAPPPRLVVVVGLCSVSPSKPELELEGAGFKFWEAA